MNERMVDQSMHSEETDLNCRLDLRDYDNILQNSIKK